MGSSKSILHTRRRFVYAGDPEDIRLYIEGLGYDTKDVLSEGKTIGFDIIGTTVRVDFDISVGERVVARGMISVTNNQLTVGNDVEKAEQSLKLYEQLNRRFRESGAKK